MDIGTRIPLNNGVRMPLLGLGVYKSGDDTETAVRWALETGYRLIDTASVYGNEAAVGKAVRESGIPRGEIFVTTKLWNEDQRRGCQRQDFEKSMERLGISYVDLYLVHWPIPEKIEETWAFMEALYGEGRVKAVGVSNFEICHLERIAAVSAVSPAGHQIAFHPKCPRRALVEYCGERALSVRRGVLSCAARCSTRTSSSKSQKNTEKAPPRSFSAGICSMA
jgi:diketogulonate reductase-like aldo/keto reductase